MSKLRFRAGHRPAKSAENHIVGRDGLTDRQRQKLLTSFRAGIGSKPAPTDEEARHSALLMDKLIDAPIRRPRR